MGKALERFRALSGGPDNSPNSPNSPQNAAGGPRPNLSGPIVAIVRPFAGPSGDVERVAIIAADGVPEEWARALAHLQDLPCPPWIDGRQWQHLVDGGGRMVSKWAASMAKLRWTPREILGVVEGKDDLFECGLLYAVEDAEVVAVTADGIGVRYPDGGTRTLRRSNHATASWVYGGSNA